MTEDEMAGCHHRPDGHEFEWALQADSLPAEPPGKLPNRAVTMCNFLRSHQTVSHGSGALLPSLYRDGTEPWRLSILLCSSFFLDAPFPLPLTSSPSSSPCFPAGR